MKILRLDSSVFPVLPIERESYEKMGFTEVVEIPGDTPQSIIEAGKDADIVVVISNYLKADVIEQLKKCKAIIRRGTGCDKIDLDCATEKGIIVANLSEFAIQDVADHAMMLMLALARKLYVLEHAMTKRNWIQARISNELTRIEGKTIGIIGFGNIGKSVAIRAKAFGMNIIDYHRNVRPEVEAQYGARAVPLDDLIAQSDFIMLTCPLSPETKGMIGERQFAMMKPTAFLINVARGGICDEQALAHALRTKQIAAAAIDVYEHINVFADPAGQPECCYHGLDNVILTPHCAANSKEATNESLEKSLEQIDMILQGVFPTNCVNPAVYEKVKDRFKKRA